MKEPKQVVVALRAGKREYREQVDLDSIHDHFDECVANGANPQLEAITFAHYVRPLQIDAQELDSINGNHFLYGWMESLVQSDSCPEFIYTEPVEQLEVTWTR